MKLTPKQFLVLGFLGVTYGMVVPWLMVLQMIEKTFFLSFSSFVATFLGLIFGVVGMATYYREYRNKR
jgi:hypothetical protein